MRIAQDEVLNLRLPAALRADLDGAATASNAPLSLIARKALALGLRALRSADDRDPPPPAAPAALLEATAA